jgi:epoxyqueuosine reductase
VKEQVRHRALDLGFDGCRFTTAERPAHSKQFHEWLGHGRHGEMAYLERNAAKRTNPNLVLAGAKSVITLATSYAGPTERDDVPLHATSPKEPTGVIARYARFADYHEVLAPRLKEITTFIDQLAGAGTRSLWYVDTGPLLERDLAERAGLGFIGKHTNVISRAHGNWIFLSEIITTAQFDPDSPETNHCGSCTRCMTACPTAAITAPFQLDARRCISYLTIELKGSIPVEFRRLIGNRIYGCDDCLAVCPWNRFAREGSLMKSSCRRDLDRPSLLELLALDEPAFRKRFAGTPILRTKRRGLLRNVCVALGNIGDASALSALGLATADPDAVIAEHARWAIDEIAARLQL